MTALAIYKVLLNPELQVSGYIFAKESVDKLRQHFGLQLIAGELVPYTPPNNSPTDTFIKNKIPKQNLAIFVPYMQDIKIALAHAGLHDDIRSSLTNPHL